MLSGFDIAYFMASCDKPETNRKFAEENGAEVITEARRGKGNAIRTGFQQAKADFVFMLDADYTYPGNFIPEMLDVLLDGYDVVIGSRLKGSRAS